MEHQVPPNLYDKVMTSLGREARRVAYRRFALRLFALLATSAGTVVAVWRLGAAAESSGFSEYLSLGLSDSAAMLAMGGDFATVMLETLPVTHSLVASALLLAALWSFAAFVREARAFRLA